MFWMKKLFYLFILIEFISSNEIVFRLLYIFWIIYNFHAYVKTMNYPRSNFIKNRLNKIINISFRVSKH